jgi:SMI1 / KNR4 family (SUKH-1)
MVRVMASLDAARERGYELRPGASESDIEALAAFASAPAELLDVLRESDGVYDEFGAAVVWPTAEIVTENQQMRTNPDFESLYWSFAQILFVGEDGSGDLFGYRVLPGDEVQNDIYRWEHEDDSRSWFALSLSDYFTRRE